MKTIVMLIAIATFAGTPAAAVPPQNGQRGWGATMGPVADYLIDEGTEIALALSAAPDFVARDATVLVFTGDGHKEARSGNNGFVCLVERSWSSPIGPHIDFFNPQLRAPICYNGEASRTVMGDYMRRTELVLAGKSIREIEDTLEVDIATGRLRPPRELAMAYMLSSAQILGTEVGNFKPHLMFYVPYATTEQLGSPPPGCSHACMFEHAGTPLASLIVPVAEFNQVDGMR